MYNFHAVKKTLERLDKEKYQLNIQGLNILAMEYLEKEFGGFSSILIRMVTKISTPISFVTVNLIVCILNLNSGI